MLISKNSRTFALTTAGFPANARRLASNRWGENVRLLGLNLVGVKEFRNEARFDRVTLLFRDDRVMDLNAMLPEDSGWFLEEAIAINDLGQITGTGTIDGERRAYLLTPLSADGGPLPDPIPEPGPVAVFGLAAGYVWFRRTRSGC